MRSIVDRDNAARRRLDRRNGKKTSDAGHQGVGDARTSATGLA
jgi:hypothetical protein